MCAVAIRRGIGVAGSQVLEGYKRHGGKGKERNIRLITRIDDDRRWTIRWWSLVANFSSLALFYWGSSQCWWGRLLNGRFRKDFKFHFENVNFSRNYLMAPRICQSTPNTQQRTGDFRCAHLTHRPEQTHTRSIGLSRSAQASLFHAWAIKRRMGDLRGGIGHL